MATATSKPQVSPAPTLIHQLQRIGELKGYLGEYERELCGMLGLLVHLSVLPRESRGAGWPWGRRQSNHDVGLQRLQVVAGGAVCLEAWRDGRANEEWSVEMYLPGGWEALCPATLRLAQWLNGWGGMPPEMELRMQMAAETFRETGELPLARREETGGRLCGRCGEESGNLPEHIRALHDGPAARLPLAVHVRVRDGESWVQIVQGKSGQYVWTIPEELYWPEMGHPRFRPGLAHDMARVGRSRRFPRHGRFPLSDDITPFPHLARALRQLTRGQEVSGGQ
jgi:hypothetical protein